MKGYVKIYLFYSLIFLTSASLSAGLFFAYGIRVFPTEVFEGGTGFTVLGLTEASALLLRPLVLMLLGAFTVYSCFISSAACLYAGAVTGRLAIRYCLSAHNPFTHCAVLIFLIVAGTVFVMMSKEAATCRSRMRYTVPDPVELLRADATSSVIKCFTESVFTVLALSTAMYLLLIYFPL